MSGAYTGEEDVARMNRIPALVAFTLSVETGKVVKCVHDLTTDIHIPKQYIVLLFIFLNFSDFIL